VVTAAIAQRYSGVPLTLSRSIPLQVTATDTNGAGDTFATVYMIARLLGDPDPGTTASWWVKRARPTFDAPHQHGRMGGPCRVTALVARLASSRATSKLDPLCHKITWQAVMPTCPPLQHLAFQTPPRLLTRPWARPHSP
jgi:hypothetical protein